jgi:DNA-binding NtrC family response regulator
MAQPWRGNVRELEHVLLNVWAMTDENELDAAAVTTPFQPERVGDPAGIAGATPPRGSRK